MNGRQINESILDQPVTRTTTKYGQRISDREIMSYKVYKTQFKTSFYSIFIVIIIFATPNRRSLQCKKIAGCIKLSTIYRVLKWRERKINR